MPNLTNLLEYQSEDIHYASNNSEICPTTTGASALVWHLWAEERCLRGGGRRQACHGPSGRGVPSAQHGRC